MKELSQQDNLEDAQRLLKALKQALRQKSIRQSQIAEALGVSDATVRRYLSGQGLTLQILCRLCQIADMRIVDLAEMAHNDQNDLIHQLDIIQEHGLSSSVMCAFVFYLLRYGWSADEVQSECGLSDVQLVAHLTKLDRLGLIRLMPNNKVRVLTVKYPDWHQGGPVRRTFDRTARKIIQTMDYNGPEALWEMETLKLSPSSVVQLELLMRDFVGAARALAFDDRRQQRAQTEWHCIISASHPVNLQEMLSDQPS